MISNLLKMLSYIAINLPGFPLPVFLTLYPQLSSLKNTHSFGDDMRSS